MNFNKPPEGVYVNQPVILDGTEVFTPICSPEFGSPCENSCASMILSWSNDVNNSCGNRRIAAIDKVQTDSTYPLKRVL